MDIDFTGQNDVKNKDWEELTKALCNPDYFDISIDVDKELLDNLSEERIALLYPRLELVREFAEYMCCGMLKGVLKYNSAINAKDEKNSVSHWFGYLLGEGADFANYQALLLNAMRIENGLQR